MRSVTALFALSLIVSTSSLIACAPAEEDDADGSEQDLSGGSGSVESPVVYLFDNAPAAEGAAQADNTQALPKCVGALIGKTVAVTAKGCAKEGMVIGRAADKDGRRTQATITAVHVPEAADADIAVVEIDREIGGPHALITHTPLRDGYTINSFASEDGKGIFGSVFSPDVGESASIMGRMTSETEMYSTIFPNKGSKICAGDIGAPVCSSTASKIAGIRLRGTCGLSGLVVGADVVPAQAPSEPTTTNGGTGNDAQNGIAQKPGTDNTCSEGAWKVAPLGRYADFLRQYAPEAFQPLVIDKPILRKFPFTPEGLWGYKSGGNVATCKIETTKLDAVAVGTQAKVTAKVSFENMESRATPFARFGIATKSAPTKMRWLPASATTAARGDAFEATFEGTVTALSAGDYIVGFRTSANGGESWTQCDLDGIANGFDVDHQLELTVTESSTEPTTTTPGGETSPTSTEPPPPAPSDADYDSDYSDPSSDDYSSDDYSDDEDDIEPTMKRKKKSSSCSATPGGVGSSSGLPMLGALLGLAALVRRRRG